MTDDEQHDHTKNVIEENKKVESELREAVDTLRASTEEAAKRVESVRAEYRLRRRERGG